MSYNIGGVEHEADDQGYLVEPCLTTRRCG
jgi:hypothetical protein